MNAEELYQKGFRHHQNKEYELAKDFYEKALELGHAIAMNNLGYMYRNGEYFTRNIEKAKELYEMAIENGDYVHAPFNLGKMYDDEIQDFQKAKEIYEIGAKYKNSFSLSRLGWMYHKGNGVNKDVYKAELLYKESLQIKIQESNLSRLINLYKEYPSIFREEVIVDYFFEIKQEDILKEMFDQRYLSKLIENRALKRENEMLKMENERLLAHIEASPDGVLYLEALEEWNRAASRTTHTTSQAK